MALTVMPALSACGGAPSAKVASLGAQPPSDRPDAGGDQGPGEMTVQQYIDLQRRWVRCARAQGLDVPDPDDTGQVLIPVTPKLRADPGPANRAMDACAKFAVTPPDSVMKLRDEKVHLTAAEKEMFRKYTACMQTSGAPDFPDPKPNGTLGDGEWVQDSAGARRASAKCGPIVGDKPMTEHGFG